MIINQKLYSNKLSELFEKWRRNNSLWLRESLLNFTILNKAVRWHFNIYLSQYIWVYDRGSQVREWRKMYGYWIMQARRHLCLTIKAEWCGLILSQSIRVGSSEYWSPQKTMHCFSFKQKLSLNPCLFIKVTHTRTGLGIGLFYMRICTIQIL